MPGRIASLVLGCLVWGACCGTPVWAQRLGAGEAAPDFPPGAFTNGAALRLSDFEGKLVVLFFYEQQCPRCRDSIPQRNAVVAQFQGKPVVFVAVAAGDTLKDAQAYQRDTQLAMPIFADSLSLFESAYGLEISLNNIYQFRIIGPDGKLAGSSMDPSAIEAALAGVKWKYKDQGFHEQLNPAIELLEWNQWEAGMKALRPALASRNPAVKESALKLHAQLLDEARAWKQRADTLAESDPVAAFDLLTRVGIVAANDDLGREAAAALRDVRRNKQVIDELSARKALEQLAPLMSTTSPSQAGALAATCQALIQKYPDTPTGKQLKKWLELASGAKPAGST